MSHAAGSSRTYPSQSVFALYGIVQPNDPHILFTCNTHTESSEGGRWVLLCSHACQPGGDRLIKNRHLILMAIMWSASCTGALLGFDQSRGSIHTYDQTACDLRVKCPAVTRLLHPQDPPDPSHDLMRRRVRRFVQVDKARPGRSRNQHMIPFTESRVC